MCVCVSVQDIEGLSRKGVGILVRIPMFLILREPANLLATAVITYRNEDRLTRKDQIEP